MPKTKTEDISEEEPATGLPSHLVEESSNSPKENDFTFLIEEYKKIFDYLQFHFEQRDRSQRFYFTFVLGGISIVSALFQYAANNNPDLHKSWLLFILFPIVIFGRLCLRQIIALRRTTTYFRKAIITIRHQLKGKYETPLFVHDDQIKFYWEGGFNYYTTSIIMVINGFIFASCLFLICIDLFKINITSLSSNCFELGCCIIISLVAWVIGVFIQFQHYKNVLVDEDAKYDAKYKSTEGSDINKQGKKRNLMNCKEGFRRIVIILTPVTIAIGLWLLWLMYIEDYWVYNSLAEKILCNLAVVAIAFCPVIFYYSIKSGFIPMVKWVIDGFKKTEILNEENNDGKEESKN